MKNKHNDNHEFKTQYIYNKEGKKVGVFLTMEALDEFLEELEDIFYAEQALANREEDEELTHHSELLKAIPSSD